MIHHHGFLCATPDIQLSMGFQRSLGAGIFGGDGFILQKLSGTAQAWIELDGEVVIEDLQPGETLRVHPGHVGMFEASVNFGLTTIPGMTGVHMQSGGGSGANAAAITTGNNQLSTVLPPRQRRERVARGPNAVSS